MKSRFALTLSLACVLFIGSRSVFAIDLSHTTPSVPPTKVPRATPQVTTPLPKTLPHGNGGATPLRGGGATSGDEGRKSGSLRGGGATGAQSDSPNAHESTDNSTSKYRGKGATGTQPKSPDGAHKDLILPVQTRRDRPHKLGERPPNPKQVKQQQEDLTSEFLKLQLQDNTQGVSSNNDPKLPK